MTTIYWIRHGEAEGNFYRRAQGHYNSLLTKNGIAQIKTLGERFAGIPIDAVYASDRNRAAATAAAASRRADITLMRSLREIALGEWEDRTWSEIRHKWGRQYEHFSNEPEKFRLRGAETFEDVRRRIFGALNTIAAANPDKTVIVASHGMATRILAAKIAGESDITKLPHGDNASVTKIRCENGAYILDYYADNSHLGELSTLGKQHWWREGGVDIDFSFRRVNLRRDGEAFAKFRRETWLHIYGDTKLFDPAGFVAEAKMLQRGNKNAVLFATRGEEIAGMVEIEMASPVKYGAGHIGFVALEPELRGKGLGVQLIGEAVSQCRRAGLSEITLRVFEGNTGAIKFYKKLGFKAFDWEEAAGGGGRLLLMSLNIEVPDARVYAEGLL